MAASEYTRKLLWSRSAGRCAMCRCVLTEPATHIDRDAVIGLECHIRGQSPGGPRHDPAFPGDIHGYDNLLILCPTDHRKIDEQPGSYPVSKLLNLKSEHEAWVETQLDETVRPAPSFRITHPRVETTLRLTVSGRDLWTMIDGAMAWWHETPEPESLEEAELFGEFIQEITDYVEVAAEMQPRFKLEAQFQLRTRLLHLLDSGFVVYAARTNAHFRGTDHAGRTVADPLPGATIVIRRLDEMLVVDDTAQTDDEAPV